MSDDYDIQQAHLDDVERALSAANGRIAELEQALERQIHIHEGDAIRNKAMAESLARMAVCEICSGQVQLPPSDDQLRDVRDDDVSAISIPYTMTQAMARELLARREAERWKTCETAPKDGSHFQAGIFGESSAGFGHYNGKTVKWQGVLHYWSNPGEEGFYLSSGSVDYPVVFSHWRPLPAPPEY